MEPVTSFFERKEVWALVGTILAFGLNEASRLVRHLLERRRLRSALRDELEINLYQLSHKMNTMSNVIDSLKNGKILPGTSVPFATAVYSTSLSSIIHALKPRERDIVHNIYARLRIQDDFLQQFEDRFKESLKDDVAENPWKAYITKLTELREDCEITQELIKSFLAGKPIDIYNRALGKPTDPAEFTGKVTPEIVRQKRQG
jgi:hypothetical protein